MKIAAERSHRMRKVIVQAMVLLFMMLLVQLIADGGIRGTASALPQASDMAPTKLADAAATFANCRYGVTAGAGESQAVPLLGAGTFYHFSSPYWNSPLPDNGAELVHLIKTHQEKSGGIYLPAYTTNVPLDDALGNYIRNHPGDLWIVGNEVDRGPPPGQVTGGQGDMFPDMYAVAYHDIYYFIKSYDHTARVVNSGLVEVTPGRLQYLDKMWHAYMAKYGSPMPVDVWSMHVYTLPEVEPDGITPNGIANVAVGTDAWLGKRGSGAVADHCSDPNVYCYAEHDNISIFAEQVVAMRQWMKQHGQQQKPLMLTEFSILYPYEVEGDSCYLQDEHGNCFAPNRVSAFMINAFNYLNSARDNGLGYAPDNYRLVQNWIWFGVYPNVAGSSSRLVESNLSTLSQVGQTYRSHVYAEPVARNLKLDQVPGVTATIGADDKATARLAVRFLNNGNTAVTSPFNVTFYSDAARTKPIGTATVSPLVRGCALSSYEAVVNWSGLTPGTHQFWVTLDSSNAIDESSPGNDDNHGTGYVLVNTHRFLLPALWLWK